MKTCGELIREARQAQGYSVRFVAREVDLAASYLSDIELGRRIPSEKVIHQLCSLLGMDFDVLMQKAGRIGEDAETYLKSSALVGRLLRQMAQEQVNEDGLRLLLSTVYKMSKRYKGKPQGDAPVHSGA